MSRPFALFFDLLAFAAFVLAGHSRHQEATGALSLLKTFAPFALAWLLATQLTHLWRHPVSPSLAARSLVLALPLAFALRWSVGDGVAFSFMVVTAVVMTTAIVGWRLAAVSLVRS